MASDRQRLAWWLALRWSSIFATGICAGVAWAQPGTRWHAWGLAALVGAVAWGFAIARVWGIEDARKAKVSP